MIDDQPAVADLGGERAASLLALVAEESRRPADPDRAVELAVPRGEFLGERVQVEAGAAVLGGEHAGERVVAALDRCEQDERRRPVTVMQGALRAAADF